MTGTIRASSDDRREPFAFDPGRISLRGGFSGPTLRATLDDPRIQKLRMLIREAMKLQDTTKRLIADIADQLQRSKSISPDQPQRERRKKPRDG